MTTRVLSVLALVLAISAVDCVYARTSFEEVAAGLREGKSSSRSTSVSSTQKTISASVSCSSQSYSDSFQFYVDGYAEAVATLVKDACELDWDDHYLTSLQTNAYDWAAAIAWATVDTSAKCRSKVSGGGRAEGCALSDGVASAFELAFADAHASAVAAAYDNYCLCGNTGSFSFGESEIVLTLFASATAEASSTACASGTQKSSASATVDCFAGIIAEVYAKAVANAVIDNQCGYWQNNAVTSSAKAQVSADINTVEFCEIKQSKKGLSGTRAAGSADTYADS